MSPLSDDRAAELRSLFFESAEELLLTLNEHALKLEKSPEDTENLRAMRRVVHTLKGDAAACGYREMSESAHAFEDVLMAEDSVERKAVAEVAFIACDLFSAMLNAYRRRKRTPSTLALHKRLAKLNTATKEKPAGKSRARTVKRPAGSNPVQWSEYELRVVEHARSNEQPVYGVRLGLDRGCAMVEAALHMVNAALARCGTLLSFRPDSAQELAESRQIIAILASNQAPERLQSQLLIPGVIGQLDTHILHQPAPTSPAKTQATTDAGPAQPETPAGVEHTLRVDAERIDNVLNQLGELILGRSMLQQAVQEFAERFPRDPMRSRLTDALAFQSRVLNELQRSVMMIRMVPVEQLFRRFPRLVRDAARQCGRDVDLVLGGQDTDLDKSILDALAEPIGHLIRNAISHGLESAEDRRQAGKPERGMLRLDAYHQGNQVVLEISDDGRGIDIEKIRRKAVARGLVTAEDASQLSQDEIYKFIFMPGFTTAEVVTEISGRGVGLDVVQNTIERLKGTVSLESTAGKGTTFRLRLPLTLAIIKAVLFRVENRLYAVPLNTVGEMTRACESDVHRVEGKEVVQIRKEVLPLVRLGRPAPAEAEADESRFFVLVVRLGAERHGLVVDEITGQEELVIKAVDNHLVTSDLISGASILGNGRVVLVLNLLAVLERARQAKGPQGNTGWGLLLPTSEVRKAAAGLGAEKIQ
jgi:two-component system, chemotaxis family, sensor kinase CheA